jgi:hypothetical protein
MQSNKVGQRRIKPVGVAAQPVAEESQQFARLDCVDRIEAKK